MPALVFGERSAEKNIGEFKEESIVRSLSGQGEPAVNFLTGGGELGDPGRNRSACDVKTGPSNPVLS